MGKLQRVILILVCLVSFCYAYHGGTHIRGDYIPYGSEYEIGNLTVYESPNRYPKRVLIGIHDFYGVHTNFKQVADVLSKTYNFRVVLPNLFRIDCPFSPAKKTGADLQAFVTKNGDWDKIVKYDILNIINTFKIKGGITEVGIYGMCLGGTIAMLAASQIDEIKVAGMVHPANIKTSDALAVNRPTYIMPAKNDPDMLPFYEILVQKFGENSGHKRFDDMLHGFAGSVGNFSNPLIAKRVEQVIDILGEFFNKNLENSY